VKTKFALLVLFALPMGAHADVFNFKDLPGFEQCMQTPHLIEEIKTDQGIQKRQQGEVEIQMRCIASAVNLLTPRKSQDTDLAFIHAAKRLTAHENVVDLVGVLADHAPAGCNDLAAYTVLTTALSHPKETGSTSLFARTKRVVQQCLKNRQFQADFLEEKDARNTYLAKNACEILRDEKMVKVCKTAL
jgi:hypothetical protein